MQINTLSFMFCKAWEIFQSLKYVYLGVDVRGMYLKRLVLELEQGFRTLL